MKLRLAATRRLVIFDCDGTLVDSQHLIVCAMQGAFADIGHAPPCPSAVRRVVGLSVPEAVASLARDLAAERQRDIALRFKENFNTLRYRGDVSEVLFPDTAAMLKRLAEADYILGIATGKSMQGLERTLANHGLRSYFTTLQTADMHPSKPHPAMVTAAMDDVGARREETVLIGDTTYDMEMALNAGITAVGVTWGYHDAKELMAAGARTVASAAAELHDTLSEFVTQPTMEGERT